MQLFSDKNFSSRDADFKSILSSVLVLQVGNSL